MRLIDADALRDCLHIKEKCEDCHYFNKDCSTKQEYTLRDICGWIDEVDVIDAIPVEWLEARKTKYYEDWGVVPVSVGEALTMWQKGQEART